MEGVPCWYCQERAATEYVHDSTEDITVPLCLDCATGITQMMEIVAAVSTAFRKSLRILTGQDVSEEHPE